MILRKLLPAAAQLTCGIRSSSGAAPARLAAPAHRAARVAGVVDLRVRSPARHFPGISGAAARRARAGVTAADSYGGEVPSVERRMSTSYAFAGELFTDSYQFVIPVYQRVYEWQKEEVELLLNDLESRLDTSLDVNALEPYPLGMLTLKRQTTTASDKKHDVVDGQQRLTTLSLILAAVKQHLGRDDAGAHEAYDAFLMQTASSLTNRKAGPRLLVWSEARSLYERVLQERQPQDWAAVAGALTAKDVVAARMAENMSVVAAYLDDIKDDAKVEQLAKYILLRCEFAVSVTADQQLAVQVFRSQTGRGKDLQPSDILKAELIAALGATPAGGEDEGNAFATRWQEMETDIGRERLQELLFYTMRLHDDGLAGMPAGNEFGVLSAFTARLRKKEDGLVDFARNVLPVALDAFCTAARPKTYGSDTDSADVQVRRLLEALSYNASKSAEWMPLVMRVLMRRDTAAKTAQTLRRVEKLAAYLTMCVSNAKARAERYTAAGLAVATDGVAPLQLSEDEAAAMRAAIDEPLLYKKRYAKLVLLRADLALRDTGTANEALVKSATVEHVLPQSPAEGSNWLRDFADVSQREALTHSLGNLMLVTRAKNARAGRSDFKEKLESYFKRLDGNASYTEFCVSDTVNAEQRWTPEVVLRRHKMLRDALCGSCGWNI